MKEIKLGYIIAVGHHVGKVKEVFKSGTTLLVDFAEKERQCMCRFNPGGLCLLKDGKWYLEMRDLSLKLVNIYQTKNHMKHFPNACNINDPRASLYQSNYKGTSFDT